MCVQEKILQIGNLIEQRDYRNALIKIQEIQAPELILHKDFITLSQALHAYIVMLAKAPNFALAATQELSRFSFLASGGHAEQYMSLFFDARVIDLQTQDACLRLLLSSSYEQAKILGIRIISHPHFGRKLSAMSPNAYDFAAPGIFPSHLQVSELFETLEQLERFNLHEPLARLETLIFSRATGPTLEPKFSPSPPACPNFK